MTADGARRLERAEITSALERFVPLSSGASEARAATVAVAIGGPEHDRRMLLTKRLSRMRAHPGQFALPGGRIDSGETARQACLRELHEELGLVVSDADVLGRLDDYNTRSGYTITPFVLWVGDRLDGVVPSVGEVDVVYEVTESELDTDARFVSIAESSRPVVQWPFRDSLVHAPTGAIVHQFREVVLHGRHTRVADFEQPVFAWR